VLNVNANALQEAADAQEPRRMGTVCPTLKPDLHWKARRRDCHENLARTFGSKVNLHASTRPATIPIGARSCVSCIKPKCEAGVVFNPNYRIRPTVHLAAPQKGNQNRLLLFSREIDQPQDYAPHRENGHGKLRNKFATRFQVEEKHGLAISTVGITGVQQRIAPWNR